jgi:hypothetical protein
VRAERIRGHGALADEERAGPVGHVDGLDGLLLDPLHGHEAHRRALDRFADRLRIQSVALAALDVALHRGPRDGAPLGAHAFGGGARGATDAAGVGGIKEASRLA